MNNEELENPVCFFTKISGFLTESDFICKKRDEEHSCKNFQEWLSIPAPSFFFLSALLLCSEWDNITHRCNTGFFSE